MPKKRMKVRRRGEVGEPILDEKHRQDVQNWSSIPHAKRTAEPPQPRTTPPPTYTAVLLKEDEMWEHPDFGEIQGVAGHYKVWKTGEDENTAVQIHADDYTRQFEGV